MDLNRVATSFERRRSVSQPDIMNDPAFDTNAGKGKHADEPDTCRICRGEGSAAEPLFYPCKCSGSIKFVHQDCLMEWLSHSQKKHCELCKTPFKFTKLYDPNMPQQLPAPVFLKQLAIHGARSLLTWFRFVFVTFVWLGWLPWSMRAVWRGLFWLADGRWPTSEAYFKQALVAGNQTLEQLAMQGTSPVTNLLSSNLEATSTAAENISSALSELWPAAGALVNMTAGQPLIYSVAKRLLLNTLSSSSPSSMDASNSTIANSTAQVTRRLRQPSWLSDVSFLTSLTPYSTLNNILIDTLEGQIITLAVVIAFILVFLIREWVVQQQPALNVADDQDAMRLGPDGELNRPDEPRDEEDVELQDPEPLEEAEVDEAPPNDEEPTPSTTDSRPSTPQNTALFEPFGGVESLHPTRLSHSDNLRQHQFGIPREEDHDVANTDVIDETAAGQDPNVAAAPAARLDAFKDLWARGRGNPTEILAIIEQEGRQDELAWIVSAMRRLELAARRTEPDELATRGPLRYHADYTSVERLRGDEYAGPSTPHSFLTNDAPRNEGAPGVQDPSDPDLSSFSVRFGDPNSGSDLATRSFSPSLLNLERFPSTENFRPEPPRPSRPENELGGLEDTTEAATLGQLRFRRHMEAQAREIIQARMAAEEPPAVPILQEQPSIHVEQPESSAPPPPTDPIHPPMSIFELVTDWLWGDVPPLPPSPVENPAVGVAGLENEGGADQQQANGAAPPNAPADPNDPDAVDDADDLEGIMELIGMQGPIFGLLQNAVFSALLISFTVTVGIWLPYLWGKIALVLMTNPVRLFVRVPFAVLSVFADITVDIVFGSVAYAVYCVNVLLRSLLAHMATFMPALGKLSGPNVITAASLSLMDGSSQRLRRIVGSLFTFHESDLPMFSVLAHQALKMHQARLGMVFQHVFGVARAVVYDFPLLLLEQGGLQKIFSSIMAVQPRDILSTIIDTAQTIFNSVLILLGRGNLASLKAAGGNHKATFPLDYDLSHWDTKDRIIAILVGYCFASLIGVLYLKISTMISGRTPEQRVDGPIAEILQQAGGVMKVIVIIGIEMIVFPLYCGILLDLALMPIFENATLASRTAFMFESPFTSLFVHWFIGTCYMFHFALFVSMCRKIMRSGVLYFIRDPDDPTFHPVRDVLERSITTQLRKIAFSALVYGGLVMVCLGGVVWGLSFAFKGVLPIHWSSNEPVLEFPVDLLFYNFVMPLAIRSIRPSDGLNNMYDWWFHKCARILRLTNFLFGERKQDEEGHSLYRTWRDVVLRYKETGDEHVSDEDGKEPANKEESPASFTPDGRFVRTPASDQVRIPKEGQVFLEVTEDNKRVDGKPDRDDGLHGRKNEMFATVYIPPKFKTRIAAFIFLIWAFAGATGVGSTIVPLVIGRRMIASFFPNHVRMNDLYALSAGIYTVGALIYAVVYSRRILGSVRSYLQSYSISPKQAVIEATLHILQLVYISMVFALLLPTLFALVTELYLLVPLHTYLNGDQEHMIHFVQDWTLGVLYVRMTLRLILWYSDSRPALALNAILRNGWLRPDVKLATRAFVVPATVLTLVALLGPLPIGVFLNGTFFRGSTAAMHSQVYRYCYPGFLVALFGVWALYSLRQQIGVWHGRVRDDVYLIGERLHNFGEKRRRDVGAARRMITS
ncbi:hypothetical protein AJ80_02233 [Polytolypa hystricis UAMH7299]|uniref:RING-type E3 ubiquitin transferase n=1 Tax=Polytolypa hystricis (strain UAMH7299) TaxID=1447883 RepID=A0A2B7YSN3_POLH7|nr:hypothetical protein AJ80_02233 [Polytolypa hystricis UAMH7299]